MSSAEDSEKELIESSDNKVTVDELLLLGGEQQKIQDARSTDEEHNEIDFVALCVEGREIRDGLTTENQPHAYLCVQTQMEKSLIMILDSGSTGEIVLTPSATKRLDLQADCMAAEFTISPFRKTLFPKFKNLDGAIDIGRPEEPRLFDKNKSEVSESIQNKLLIEGSNRMNTVGMGCFIKSKKIPVFFPQKHIVKIEDEGEKVAAKIEFRQQHELELIEVVEETTFYKKVKVKIIENRPFVPIILVKKQCQIKSLALLDTGGSNYISCRNTIAKVGTDIDSVIIGENDIIISDMRFLDKTKRKMAMNLFPSKQDSDEVEEDETGLISIGSGFFAVFEMVIFNLGCNAPYIGFKKPLIPTVIEDEEVHVSPQGGRNLEDDSEDWDFEGDSE